MMMNMMEKKHSITKHQYMNIYNNLATFVQRCIIIYNKNCPLKPFMDTRDPLYNMIPIHLSIVAATQAFFFYYVHSTCFQCLLHASGVQIPIVPARPGIHIKENMFKAWNPLGSLAA